MAGFDRSAAVTRSLLGWGVVAGPFYLAFGIVVALLSEGFELSRDALSLLLLGDLGWLHMLNLRIAGLMTLAAAIGLWRTPGRPRAVAIFVGLYAAGLLVIPLFPPDPTEHYPPGVGAGEATTAGLLHLAIGALGFLAMAAAAILARPWLRRRRVPAAWSTTAGVVIAAGFAGGAALAQSTAGVALLWLAVLVTWGWLAAISITAYRAVPHPDLDRRT